MRSQKPTTQINNTNFKESDVTLIRKKPLNAPKIKYGIDWTSGKAVDGTEIYKEKFVRFAYRTYKKYWQDKRFGLPIS